MEIFYQMCASIVAIFKCTACLHTSHPPPPTRPNSQRSRQHDFDKGKTYYHETCHMRCEIKPVSYLSLNDLQQMWFMSSP